MSARRLLVPAALVLSAAAIWLALRPRPLVLEVAVAARRPLVVTVDEEGRTRVRDRYVVTAPLAGRVDRLLLAEGDAVRAGQVVARLAPLPLDAPARTAARARLEAALDAERTQVALVQEAREAHAQALRDLDRNERLFASGMIADQAVEAARLLASSRREGLAAAETRREAARHDVEAARAALHEGAARREIPITSPVAGHVLRLPERSARTVAAGAVLLELGDPGALEVVTELLSQDAVRVRPGDSLWVVDWGGPDTLRGVIRRVEPSAFTKVSALGVEEQRVVVVGELPTPPPALGDGYRVESRVVVARAAEALQVPASALLRVGAGWQVAAVRDGRIWFVPVEVGRRGAEGAEITAGLAAGDTVVAQPDDRLEEGVRVDGRPAP